VARCCRLVIVHALPRNACLAGPVLALQNGHVVGQGSTVVASSGSSRISDTVGPRSRPTVHHGSLTRREPHPARGTRAVGVRGRFGF
jgi:hypothetical protein